VLIPRIDYRLDATSSYAAQPRSRRACGPEPLFVDSRSRCAGRAHGALPKRGWSASGPNWAVEFMEKALGLWAGSAQRPVVPPKAVRTAALKHLHTILSQACAGAGGRRAWFARVCLASLRGEGTTLGWPLGMVGGASRRTWSGRPSGPRSCSSTSCRTRTRPYRRPSLPFHAIPSSPSTSDVDHSKSRARLALCRLQRLCDDGPQSPPQRTCALRRPASRGCARCSRYLSSCSAPRARTKATSSS
jgi:hypothetical protein